MNRMKRLREAGVSIWLDALSREPLETGRFERLARLRGQRATSNPTAFAKAITGSDRSDEQLLSLASTGVGDTQQLFFEIHDGYVPFLRYIPASAAASLMNSPRCSAAQNG